MKMETTPIICFLCYYLFMAMCCCFGNTMQTIESPKYTVIQSESDFQIRLYNESSSWMSAPSSATSFEQSTKTGFHRLYQYMHGANSNASKLAFTAPILTRIPSSTSSSGDGYSVQMYLSSHFQGKPPQPNQELKLQLEKWKTQCIAVRKFSGYAKDDNINKEIQALESSLNKHIDGVSTMTQDTTSYTIAQYNASFRDTQRVNEVWIKVSGLRIDC